MVSILKYLHLEQYGIYCLPISIKITELLNLFIRISKTK